MDHPAHHAGPRARWPLFHLALSALCLDVTACEWVLDGIPSLRGNGALDAGPQWEAGPLVPFDGGDLPALPEGPPTDAEPALGPDGASAPTDAGPPPLPCVPGASVYRDSDGDGYGSGVPLRLSCPPGFRYSAETGDCNDGNPDVHPGQTRFFGTPYEADDGSSSFDYDCSGAEDGNGRQAVLGTCGLLGAAFCQGEGYAPSNARFGAFGINTACGSTLVQECRAELFGTASCRATAGTRADPYVCR